MDFDAPPPETDANEVNARATSQRSNMLSLLDVHRIEWVTGTRDGPDFHQYATSCVRSNNVDLGASKLTVAIEDLQTLALKPIGGKRLTPSAKV